jgi:hypothetical protein
MLTGRLFRLKYPVLAVESEEGKELAVSLPKGALLRVMGKSRHAKMVEVAWLGRHLSIFEIDLRERGDETSIAEV